jgi:DNA repair exonuclease SbcCD nuclease subunit
MLQMLDILMSKILLFSDIHINSHKSSFKRLEDCLKVLEWSLQTALDEGADNVIFCGDLFHERQKIQVLAYHKTYQILSKFSDLHIYLLLGNHDLWYYDKWDISSVFPLGALSNVTVIGETQTINIDGLDVDFLPFTHDPLTVIKERFSKKSRVLCAHVAINGATLNFHHRTKSEVSIEFENDMVPINVDIFEGWEKVFLGHYHGAQKLNHFVEYIGSPLQLTYNEAFQKKHICVLDTVDLDVKYIENNFSPKHLIIEADEVDNYELDNNFVQVYVDELHSTDLTEMRNNILRDKENVHLEFRESKKLQVTDNEALTKFNIADGDVLERYIKISNTNLDLNRLLNVGRSIVNGEA